MFILSSLLLLLSASHCVTSVALQNTTTGDPATPTSHPFESLSLATKVVIYVVALLLAGGFVIIACSCLVGACFCGKPCWTRKDIGQQNQHHHQPSEETPLTPRTTSPVSTLRSSSTAQNSGSSDNLGAGGSAQADSGLGSRPMGDGGGRFNGTYRSVPEDDMKGTNRNASSNIHATSDPTLAS